MRLPTRIRWPQPMTKLGPFPRPFCTFCGTGVGHGYFTAEEVRNFGDLPRAFSRYNSTWYFRERDPYYCEECCEANEFEPEGHEGHVYEYSRDDRDWLCRTCNASAPNDFYNDW